MRHNALTMCLTLLLQRPDLKEEAIQGKLCEALLEALRYHKADSASGALADALLQLTLERESWPCICDAGRSLMHYLYVAEGW